MTLATRFGRAHPAPYRARSSLRLALALGALLLACFLPSGPQALAQPAELRVPVLVYHRVAPSKLDGMTVRTSTLDAQLRTLREDGWRVIRLRELIAALDDPRRALPAKSVVLTADDGHLSVYTQLYPRLRDAGYPLTLFIYPSAISNANYAMTWTQLDAMRRSGLVDLQSHAYWHPNFAEERKRLAPAQFQALLRTQLENARGTLRRHGAGDVALLAWPFGIVDNELMRAARTAGYAAAFGIQRRPVRRSEQRYALPRYIVTDEDVGPRFLGLLNDTSAR